MPAVCQALLIEQIDKVTVLTVDEADKQVSKQAENKTGCYDRVTGWLI